jgi:hypothetical protein
LGYVESFDLKENTQGSGIVPVTVPVEVFPLTTESGVNVSEDNAIVGRVAVVLLLPEPRLQPGSPIDKPRTSTVQKLS